MFRQPQSRKIGVKVLGQGKTGSGKSKFALTFPKVFALDSETGLAMYEGSSPNLLGIANTQDFNQLQKAIKEVEAMVKKDEGSIGTLSIDSETKFYDNLKDTALRLEETKGRKAGRDVNDSNISVRGWGRIKSVATRLQNLKLDLSALGVNVVSIAQVEDVKEKIGDSFKVVGEKANMAKNADYDYDIIVHFFTEETPDGETHYKGKILKDRTGVCKKGQIIDNPSYNIWKEHLESGKGLIVDSNLTNDSTQALEALVKEDLEESKTDTDIFKELMLNDKCKEIGLGLIKEHKIKNPLQPANTREREVMSKIIEAMKEAIA